MSFGTLFGRTLSTFGRNFGAFFVMALIMYLPLYVYAFFALGAGASGAVKVAEGRDVAEGLAALLGDMTAGLSFARDMQIFLLVQTVGGALLSMVLSGALTYGVVQDLAGKRPSMGECLSMGLRRLAPVLGTAFLGGLAVAGGFIALIIPGLILYCMFAVSVPVAVIENLGPVEALKRSAALTLNYKGTIFGVIFVVGVIQSIASYAFQSALLGGGVPSFSTLRIFLFVSIALAMVGGILNATLASVAYNDLRQVKEGVQTAELAAVFD